MTRTPTRLAAAAIAGAAVFATTAPPANAEVFDQFTWDFSEILTNAETGEWFRITSNSVFKEGGPLKEVSPGVYTYTVREPGNLGTIWDSSGRQVARDSGLVVSQVTFDTGGDDVPGGEELDWQLVAVHGPHPLMDADFCEVATDLIG